MYPNLGISGHRTGYLCQEASTFHNEGEYKRSLDSAQDGTCSDWAFSFPVTAPGSVLVQTGAECSQPWQEWPRRPKASYTSLYPTLHEHKGREIKSQAPTHTPHSKRSCTSPQLLGPPQFPFFNELHATTNTQRVPGTSLQFPKVCHTRTSWEAAGIREHAHMAVTPTGDFPTF